MRRLRVALVVGMMGMSGCAASEDAQVDAVQEEPAELILGPADGHEMSATDLERVAVGAMAPDFTLAALNGPPVTLSSFRGEKNVVLVFYRGHW